MRRLSLKLDAIDELANQVLLPAHKIEEMFKTSRQDGTCTVEQVARFAKSTAVWNIKSGRVDAGCRGPSGSRLVATVPRTIRDAADATQI